MDIMDEELASQAIAGAYAFFGGNIDYEQWADAVKSAELVKNDRCCLKCQVKWRLADGTTDRCWVCNNIGKIGIIEDYCSHGTKKYIPFKEFHCPQCSSP